VEEFQVGDTCKASVAQKQLREVILLRGAMQFWLILVPAKFRKTPPAKVVPFREPGFLRLPLEVSDHIRIMWKLCINHRNMPLFVQNITSYNLFSMKEHIM